MRRSAAADRENPQDVRKTVYLHAGMPKCGSTTLQQFLEYNRDVLRYRGVVYKRNSGDKTKGQGNGAEFLKIVMEQSRGDVEQYFKTLFNEGYNCIISNENFIVLRYSAKKIRMMQEVASQHGFSLEVVIAIRRQDYWIESDFKQHVKSFPGWIGGIEELLAKRDKAAVLDYESAIGRWGDVLGDDSVHVIALEQNGSPDVVVEFMRRLGIDDLTGFQLPMRENVSPSADVIEAARLLKRELIDRGLGPAEVQSRVEEFIRKAATISPGGSPYVMAPEQRAALVRRHAGTNLRLARRFLGRDRLFSEDIRPDVEQWRPPRAEALLVDMIWSDLAVERAHR